MYGVQVMSHPRVRRLIPLWLRRATGLDKYEKDDVADFVRMASAGSASKKAAPSPRVVKVMSLVRSARLGSCTVRHKACANSDRRGLTLSIVNRGMPVKIQAPPSRQQPGLHAKR
jgi:hypothetical protein